MQRLNQLVFIFAITFILFACNEQDSASSSDSADVPADQIAANVNGTIISKDDVALFKTIKRQSTSRRQKASGRNCCD